MNKLAYSSLSWSLSHLIYEGDTDLFPRPFEIQIIKNNWESLKEYLENIDITSYKWKDDRKLVLPKDEVSFRLVTQLSPIDSLIFSAIIREIGEMIEEKRIDVQNKRVFSYRFNPTDKGRFYGEKNQWDLFWRYSVDVATRSNFVVVTDISDFYNQIYHHTIENQLDECGVGKKYVTAIKHLIKNITKGVSRGIPVGPHASHMLAELALIPVDNYLQLKGYDFCRYVDDFHIFCNSKQEAQTAIYELANVINNTHKMVLNRRKTDIFPTGKFIDKAMQILSDNPINDTERITLETIRGKTPGPYAYITLDDLTEEDLEKLSKKNIENVLENYIGQQRPNYVRLGWFLRRLSQVGVPGGVEFIINNMESFMPCIADVANYLKSAHNNYFGSWEDIGGRLLEILKMPLVERIEYIQIILLSMFSRIKDTNHIGELIQVFDRYNYSGKREIILAAVEAGARDWLRNFKDNYSSYNPWVKRALIFSSKTFPKDEREFWLKYVNKESDELEKAIIHTIKN